MLNLLCLPDGRLRAGWRVLLGILVAVFANVVAAGVAVSSTELVGQAAFELIYRPLTLVLLLVGFGLLVVFADRAPQGPLAGQGLPRRNWGRDFLLGMLIGTTLIACAVLVMKVGGNVVFRTAFSARGLRQELLVLLVLGAAAMVEELMFRGYPFQRLVEAVGAVPAVLLLSALFAYMHHQNPHASTWAMVNTVAVGVLLALAYLRSHALWLPWGIHFGWNAALGLGFGLPVSGLDFSVLVKGSARGPQWLTGGAYGLEASVLGTLVILLGFVPVLRLFPRARPRNRLETDGEWGRGSIEENEASPGA